jgi:hypothetical protein
VNRIFNFPDRSIAGKEKVQTCVVYDRDLYRELAALGLGSFHEWVKEFESLFYEEISGVFDVGKYYLISPRRAYQLFGTELFREVDQDFWIKRLNIKDEKRIVIDDLRFNNEAEHIIKNDGIIVEVVNPRKESTSTHASEAGIKRKYIRQTIVNDWDYDSLFDAVDDFMFTLGIEKQEDYG